MPSLKTKIDTFVQNMQKLDSVINGSDATSVDTPSGALPSIAKLFKDNLISPILNMSLLANKSLSAGGAALIGYDGFTVQQVLDTSRPLTDYTALRAYTGRATTIQITKAGLAGFFYRDDVDTTSTDNGGTVIIDGASRRWKRIYSGPVNVRWFGAVGDGVADDAPKIQAALDIFLTTPFGGVVHAPRGTYLIGTDIQLFRSIAFVGDGKDATVIKISGNHAGITQKMINGGSTGAQNVFVRDLQILGEDDGAKTLQHGFVCSSSLQYSTVERVLIKNVGGNGLHAPVSALGAIFNTFRDIEIIQPRGYGHFFAGNYGQNVHERVRIFGGYSHGFVTDGTNNSGSNPLANTFIGCAYESTKNTTGDTYGVWFVSDTVYNAYETSFINCYFENFGRVTGDAVAYKIGAAKGVNIIGGVCNFVHWGVVTTSQYSEGVYLQGVCFICSPTWGGSANLTGKAMLQVQNANAHVHVGPQCSAQLAGGVVWDTMDAASLGRIHGYLSFQDKKLSAKEITAYCPSGLSSARPGATASRAGQMFLTLGATGFADHLDVCIKDSTDTYVWVPVGNHANYKGTFAFPGVTVAAGATQALTISVTGADVGRFLEVANAVDIGGLTLTKSIPSLGNIRLTFTNPTAASVTLAAGTWGYMVRV